MRIKREVWKITDCRVDMRREPEMSWQEKLFWAMDKPLHMFAYIIFFLSLSLIATWVLQAGQAGGC